MNDEDFLHAFEETSLAAESFDHRAHLRMAWLYLRTGGSAGGAARIVEGLRAFAAAKGVPEKYEVTTTRTWIGRVAVAIGRHPEVSDFGAFPAQSPELLTRGREPATDTSSQPYGTDATAPLAASARRASGAPSS